MSKYFNLKWKGNLIIITANNLPNLLNMTVYIDQQYIGSVAFGQQVILNSTHFTNPSTIAVQGTLNVDGTLNTVTEAFFLKNTEWSRNLANTISYKPGDILIASDNVNGLPPGYMGHSAIVVDTDSIIEVVGTSPIVRKSPISSFTDDHPSHAQFRPKSAQMGEDAAKYAVNYLNNYNHASKTPDASVPIFNFSLSTKLSDEWEYIYCSKLIWLSYYYGANYEFKNDHLWFAPEDLYSLLKDSDEFEVIYIYPDFKFKIDL